MGANKKYNDSNVISRIIRMLQTKYGEVGDYVTNVQVIKGAIVELTNRKITVPLSAIEDVDYPDAVAESFDFMISTYVPNSK